MQPAVGLFHSESVSRTIHSRDTAFGILHTAIRLGWVLWLVMVCHCTLSAAVQSKTIAGREVVSLPDVSSHLGMRMRWVEKGERISISNKWTSIDIRGKERHILINNIKISLGRPVLFYRNQLHIDTLDWHFSLLPILTPQQFKPSKPGPIKTIVIDPGHGGKDPGAVDKRTGLQEKNLTLDVSKRIQQHLTRAGYRVVLTRENDTFIALEDRTIIANRHKADLFLSIHFNSHADGSAQGIETFAFTLINHPSTARSTPVKSDRLHAEANRHDPWNALLGYHLQNRLIRGLAEKDRGLKRARFTVLRDIRCPAALIELGFVSHPETARKLQNANYRGQLAQNVAQGVIDYAGRIHEIR